MHLPPPARAAQSFRPGLAGLAVGLGLALPAGSPAAAQALQWTGQLAAASELSDRGLVIGPRRPTLQASLTAVLDRRWTLGLGTSSPLGAGRQARVLAQLGRYEAVSDDCQL